MTENSAPERGAIITYPDSGTAGPPFRRGVVTEDRVVDPMTNELWISVLRPDYGNTLVDPALILAVDEASELD
jgi:hypothetical protein